MPNFVKNAVVALKGFAMGTANVIPGVSGGTIALLTGIFNELIEALNAVLSISSWKLPFKGQFKEFWKLIHGTFLLWLGGGVTVSVFSLAKVMEYVLAYHPVQTWAFFFGLIVVSGIYMLYDIKKWKVSDGLWLVFGIILGAVICLLSPTRTTDASWFIVVCGAIAICTMILPGISGSFILVILGKYDYVLGAVAGLTSFSKAQEATAALSTGPMSWGHCLLVICIFAVGAAIGIIAFSKFLHWLLSRWNRETVLILAGFIIGSLIKVWPWHGQYIISAGSQARELPALPGVADSLGTVIPVDDAHIAGAIVFALLGLGLVVGIELAGKAIARKRKAQCDRIS